VSEIPEELKFSNEHEWVRMEGDEVVVGITDFAQGELGDVVFVEFPEIGGMVTYGEPFGTIEAVKAASDLFSPVTGEVVDVNAAVVEDPGVINKSAYIEGWMIRVKITDTAALDELFDAQKYKDMIGE